MPDFDRDDLSPATQFICWLLQEDRSRKDAGAYARRLGVRLDYAQFYFENIRRR